MITIDKLETITDKLLERARALHFEFANEDLGKEAEGIKDEIVSLIESYQELAVQDWEERREEDKSDEDSETA